MRQSVDVHNFLQNADIPHEIFLMEAPSKNAEQTAAILGLKPKEVVKSVIFFINGRPVNAVVPSNRKVSLKKLKTSLPDSNIELASSKNVVETTGYVLGATPPVAHKKSCQTFIDEECMSLGVLYTGGGELNAMLKIRPEDLKRLTNARIMDISE